MAGRSMCGLVMRTRRIPSVLSLSNSVGTPQRSLHTLSAIFSTPIEPLFSDKTRDLLRNVYQKGYIDELNNLTPDTPFEHFHLELLVKETAKNHEYAQIFNNASSAWSNDFFFHILTTKQTKPSALLDRRFNYHFGGIEQFKDQFKAKALSLFGNGWIWLVEDEKHNLLILPYFNSGSPLVPESLHPIDKQDQETKEEEPIYGLTTEYQAAKKELLSTLRYGLLKTKSQSSEQDQKQYTPIACLNMWEHAYLNDYSNDKEQYIKNFFQMINWDLIQHYMSDWKPPIK